MKIKRVFENFIWWSGVLTVGIILGVSLQVVKAWTEPSGPPPTGNLGTPINTSVIGQFKNGFLRVIGFQTDSLRFTNPIPNNDITGNVLTAQNSSGDVEWAAPTGGALSDCVIKRRFGNDGNDNIATCPAGYRLTGGGYINNGGYAFISAPWNSVTRNWCNDGDTACDSWKSCYGIAGPPCQLRGTVFAVCCK